MDEITIDQLQQNLADCNKEPCRHTLIKQIEDRTLHLTNGRTHTKYEINIDITKCPFPWQINFGLMCSNDCIYIVTPNS
jgi:hypothetical protein